jgi:predicted TIM-barrel fold metal-dependent hydrolase
VAADFPDMKIIMAHPSWPWTDEALSIALHKTNVFIDLSGWSPNFKPEVHDLILRQNAMRVLGLGAA